MVLSTASAPDNLWLLFREPREVVGTPSFLEEVLRVALEHGFRLDSVFPDPEDLLNSRSLRFVRH